MRYPIPKTTRAKMARLYYELCLVPGLEPRVIRSWADMLSRLLSSKPDQKRKLDTKGGATEMSTRRADRGTMLVKQIALVSSLGLVRYAKTSTINL